MVSSYVTLNDKEMNGDSSPEGLMVEAVLMTLHKEQGHYWELVRATRHILRRVRLRSVFRKLD